MKSLLLVCDDDSASEHNIPASKQNDRWFFAEKEIISRKDSTLNIPLDSYNYKPFFFDKIVTNKTNDLVDISNELTQNFFFEKKNRLIVSTSYTFGISCPYLLEGSFSNNTLVGPGILLLILKNIFLYYKDVGESDKYSIVCTWNGITSSGSFIDLFDVDTHSGEMIQMSPFNNDFGYCKGLPVSSINSFAYIINERRNSSIWKDVCHYIFTIRLFGDFYGNNTFDSNINFSSITLASLGEGLKTKHSGQSSPWDVLDILIRGLDNSSRGKNIYNLANYLSSFFVYPNLVTLIYRFPYNINPSISKHAKEIRHILNLMLFHEKFIEFLKSGASSITNKKFGLFGDTDGASIHYFDKKLQLNNHYTGSGNAINCSDMTGFSFVDETDDAPTPPPNPIKKINFEVENDLRDAVLANFTKYPTTDWSLLNSNDLECNISNTTFSEKGNIDSQQMDKFKREISSLKQEISVLENALVDKNEIIVRLEKLLEGRDNIIKHNQETIRILKEQMNDLNKEVGSRTKLKLTKKGPNDLHGEKQAVPHIGGIRPPTEDCNINIRMVCDRCSRKELSNEILISDTEELVKENIGKYQQPDANVFSGVAKMAFEKFINN